MSIWKKLFGAAPASAENSETGNAVQQEKSAPIRATRIFHHVFVYRDLVVIPTVARTTSGLYLDVEPVAAIPLSDSEVIRAALTALIAQGNPEIPLPARGDYHPPVCREAGVKSWSTMTRKSACIAIMRRGDEFTIECVPPGANESDPARTRSVPAADIVTEVLGELRVRA